MKKIALLITLCVSTSIYAIPVTKTPSILNMNLTEEQMTVEEWEKMMQEYSKSIDILIANECPADVDKSKFREAVIKGEKHLSEEAQILINNLKQPLLTYARNQAKLNAIEVESEDELLFIACFPPDSKFDEVIPNEEDGAYKQPIKHQSLASFVSFSLMNHEKICLSSYEASKFYSGENNCRSPLFRGLTWGEVAECGLIALGVDFLYAAGVTATNNTWTIRNITKAFGAVAGKMFGPIGTAIAIGTFGWCLYEQSKD